MAWYDYIFFGLGSVLVSKLLPSPEQNKPEAAKLSDFDFPTAERNRPIPVIFGSPYIKGANVVWYGDMDAEEVKGSGGKK